MSTVEGRVEVRTPRRERYQIEMEIRFGETGKTNRYSGITENISASGLLMRCPQSLPPGTAVTASFVLPGGQGERSGGRVLCRGHIVRVIPPAEATGRFGLAVSIANYSLRPSRKGIALCDHSLLFS